MEEQSRSIQIPSEAFTDLQGRAITLVNWGFSTEQSAPGLTMPPTKVSMIRNLGSCRIARFN